MKRDNMEEGETYTGVVDRISSSGNGIIECEEEHVNIGSVSEEAVGETVEFEFLGSVYGKCLQEDLTPKNYNPKSKARSKQGDPQDDKTRPSDPDNLNKLIDGRL